MMEAIIGFIVATLFTFPYRKLKMRYQLLSYQEDCDNSFFGNEEYANAFNEALNKK